MIMVTILGDTPAYTYGVLFVSILLVGLAYMDGWDRAFEWEFS